MKIDRNLWLSVLDFYESEKKKGNHVGRYKLKKAFNISENLAKILVTVLENREVFSLKPTSYSITGKCLVFGDVHIPFQDNLAIDTMFDFVKGEKITTVVILGDLIDFYQISDFVKDPSKKSVKEEIKEAKLFLERLRNLFPDAEIIYKEGNHSQRLQRYIFRNAREISDLLQNLFPALLDLDTFNVRYEVLPFRIGKLWFLHGHEKMKGAYNVEYITNVLWKYIHDHFICGHFHRTETRTFKRIDDTIFFAGCVGYLARDLDWCLLNKWNQGFAVIDFYEDGDFRVKNYRIHRGNVY